MRDEFFYVSLCDRIADDFQTSFSFFIVPLLIIVSNENAKRRFKLRMTDL